MKEIMDQQLNIRLSAAFGTTETRRERISRHRRSLFQLYVAQALVGFCHNVIDHGFHIVRPLPNSDLAVGTGAFMQNSFDMIHLAPAPELRHFGSHEFYELVNQTARLRFAFLTEIDELPIDAIARSAPAVFIQ